MSEDRGAKRNRSGLGNSVWLLAGLVLILGGLMAFYVLRPARPVSIPDAPVAERTVAERVATDQAADARRQQTARAEGSARIADRQP